MPRDSIGGAVEGLGAGLTFALKAIQRRREIDEEREFKLGVFGEQRMHDLNMLAARHEDTLELTGRSEAFQQRMLGLTDEFTRGRMGYADELAAGGEQRRFDLQRPMFDKQVELYQGQVAGMRQERQLAPIRTAIGGYTAGGRLPGDELDIPGVGAVEFPDPAIKMKVAAVQQQRNVLKDYLDVLKAASVGQERLLDDLIRLRDDDPKLFEETKKHLFGIIPYGTVPPKLEYFIPDPKTGVMPIEQMIRDLDEIHGEMLRLPGYAAEMFGGAGASLPPPGGGGGAFDQMGLGPQQQTGGLSFAGQPVDTQPQIAGPELEAQVQQLNAKPTGTIRRHREGRVEHETTQFTTWEKFANKDYDPDIEAIIDLMIRDSVKLGQPQNRSDAIRELIERGGWLSIFDPEVAKRNEQIAGVQERIRSGEITGRPALREGTTTRIKP